MEIYYTTILFILGITLGSFYNVVGYRMPKGESIAFPPSRCTTCNTRLRTIDLIPVFSYLLQRGKCRYCKEKVSAFYPLCELLNGILFAVSYLVFGFTPELAVALIFVSLTMITVVSDYKYFIILDEVLITAAVLVLIPLYFIGGFVLIGKAILSGVIAFAVMFGLKLLGNFLFKKESMGDGDIKLLAVIGMFVGIEMSIITIFLASIIGLPIALIVLLKKKDNIIPFGPFLCFSALIIILTNLNLDKILQFIS